MSGEMVDELIQLGGFAMMVVGLVLAFTVAAPFALIALVGFFLFGAMG